MQTWYGPRRPVEAGRPEQSNRSIARSTGRQHPAYRPRLGNGVADEAVLVEALAVGEIQAAQLFAFLVAMTGLLLALEIGMRRVHRRR
jgi:hypothetical protein